ncbi:hypothetical protein Taro_003819 [Colocasia esculenta]|uniref:Uncharacterized protein n=1 Tax=Colocasia esculenta TaxID=4460 RepID=A0A843TGK0_COLES|nr:hypothetical protein [Colocasia esculenta]
MREDESYLTTRPGCFVLLLDLLEAGLRLPMLEIAKELLRRWKKRKIEATAEIFLNHFSLACSPQCGMGIVYVKHHTNWMRINFSPCLSNNKGWTGRLFFVGRRKGADIPEWDFPGAAAASQSLNTVGVNHAEGYLTEYKLVKYKLSRAWVRDGDRVRETPYEPDADQLLAPPVQQQGVDRAPLLRGAEKGSGHPRVGLPREGGGALEVGGHGPFFDSGGSRGLPIAEHDDEEVAAGRGQKEMAKYAETIPVSLYLIRLDEDVSARGPAQKAKAAVRGGAEKEAPETMAIAKAASLPQSKRNEKRKAALVESQAEGRTSEEEVSNEPRDRKKKKATKSMPCVAGSAAEVEDEEEDLEPLLARGPRLRTRTPEKRVSVTPLVDCSEAVMKMSAELGLIMVSDESACSGGRAKSLVHETQEVLPSEWGAKQGGAPDEGA